ncbi:MAG TPA: hypothetical protein VJ843_01565 [Candidatus Saccharimonadales bacterium]|nr:hypothetical protein [Candidatus Saccharimonadales bacterium]
MRIVKKLSLLAAGLSTVTVMAAVPVSAQSSQSSHATTNAKTTLKGVSKHNVVKLDQSSGAAVDVSTEVDCSMHTLTAKVTNKTDQKITPNVTFNGDQPTLPSTYPIEPGRTAYYFYNFSGNHLLVKTVVDVDGQDPVTVSPTMNCLEPVSFRVDAASASAVTGYLTNNSSLVSQTVLTRVNNGDIRTESLAPGETRLIALPFNGQAGQSNAYVEIGTTTGYEGSYSVDLTKPIIRPLEK